MSNTNFENELRRLREEKGLSLRTVAAKTGIDISVLSKMERGERKLNRTVIQKLARIYHCDPEQLLVHFLSDKLLYEIENDELALKAFKVAEETVSYKSMPSVSQTNLIKGINAVLVNDGRVAKAWLFGSFARGEQTADSDVDIMIQFNQKKPYSFFDLLDLAHKIQQKIKRKVDLVEKGQLKNFALRTAENDLIKIYG